MVNSLKYKANELLVASNLHPSKLYSSTLRVGFYTITGNTKGGSITVPLTSCLTGLEMAV